MYRPTGNIKYVDVRVGYQNPYILMLFGCESFDALREGFIEPPTMWPRYSVIDLW